MGYWNRDRNLGTEPFKCWHEDCFPVYRPLTHEKFGHDSADSYAASMFGGVEHMAELALSDRYYADQVERRLTDTTRWTPDGYAWAPWAMGADCAKCGGRL